MTNVISIINQKGGVGKSTTALALTAGMAARSKKTLAIDLDAQGNLSYSLDTKNGAGAMETMDKSVLVADAIQHIGTLDVLPSSPALATADNTLTAVGKEYRLKEVLTPIIELYDFIIIDTPPALGILTINALTASTHAIIPAQADIYSLQGIGQLHGTLQAVRQYTNSQLLILGILLTRYNPRAILTRDMTDLLKDTAQSLETVVFNTKIRECIALKESQAQKQDIFTYAPKSNASFDYEDLIKEVLGKFIDTPSVNEQKVKKKRSRRNKKRAETSMPENKAVLQAASEEKSTHKD